MLRKKFYLPIGLCILVVLAVGFLFLRSQTPQEPIKIYKETTPDAPAKVSEDQKKETSISEKATGGHFHEDGTFHAEPHEHPTSPVTTNPSTELLTEDEIEQLNRLLETEGFKPEKLSEKQMLHLSRVGLHWRHLSPEQQKQVEKDAYAEKGLNPPPEGYRYNIDASGFPVLDENGNAIIKKIGDPSVQKSFGGYLK